MKCVSIDLDGTLLNSDKQISNASKEVIEKLQVKGIEVIINTGRSYNDVVGRLPVLKELNCPIFCVNGSILYSKTGDIIYETTIDINTYKEVLTTLKSLGVGILVYTNQGGLPSTLPPLKNKTKEELKEFFEAYNYDEILQRENLKIYKVIALVDNSEVERIEVVRKALANNEKISAASSYPNNLEIMSFEGEKGKALKRYEVINNVKFDEIYAFGDGGNDLSQFEVATKSVAMANSPEYVKDKATLVTKSNDEDGVVYGITNLLNLL